MMSEFGDIRSKLEDYEKITVGLREIYSKAPVAIATANSEGMFIEGNQAILNLFGIKDSSELKMLSIYDIFPLTEKNRKELKNEKPVEYSSTFDFDKLRRDGLLKTTRAGISHLQIFISPFFIREVGQAGFLSIVVDVTERRNIEIKLRESEEIYRKLVETSPDAITVTDIEGNVVTISQQTLIMHGYKSEDEVLGKSATIFIAEESLEKAQEYMRKTLEEGSIKNEEYIFLRKDGSKFPASLSASVISDSEENPTHIIGVTRDITQQKETEQTLKENAEKLRLLFDNANDSIFMFKLDKKGRMQKFAEVNETTTKWTGFTKEELLDMTPEQLLPEDVMKDVQGVIKHILEHGFLTFETDIVLKDGTRLPVEFSSSLFILDEELYILSSARKIAERVIAQKAREKEVEEKTLLLDIITHDLRNFLAPLWVCITETLEAEKIDFDELKKSALSARSSLAKTDALIDNISVLMKQDIDSTYDLKSTNILENINKCKIGLIEVFPRNNIVLNTEKVNPDHNIFADMLFELLLMNIFSNSVKNDTKDIILIIIGSKEVKEDKILLSISDHGTGIKPDEREGIFERYGEFRKKGRGSGLGLFIIQTLVKRYNGKIWIENTIEDDYKKGTTFKIEFKKSK